MLGQVRTAGYACLAVHANRICSLNTVQLLHMSMYVLCDPTYLYGLYNVCIFCLWMIYMYVCMYIINGLWFEG
jgi:hypothetical protein